MSIGVHATQLHVCGYLWSEVADFRDPVEPGTPSWLETALATDFFPRFEDRATLCMSSINRASFWTQLELVSLLPVPVSVPSLSCSTKEVTMGWWETIGG